MTDKELLEKLWDVRKLCYEVAHELERREKRGKGELDGAV